MILNITAYSHIRRVRDLRPEEDWRQVRDGLVFPVHPAFPRHALEIEPMTVYVGEERFTFDVGCYSRYNHWLEQLARLTGIPHLDPSWILPKSAPFAQLLQFTDCDATIGAAVCRELAADFAEYSRRAAGQSERYFREQYALWRHAFEAGAENGCIVFREAVSSTSSRSHECAGGSPTGTGPA